MNCPRCGSWVKFTQDGKWTIKRCTACPWVMRRNRNLALEKQL